MVSPAIVYENGTYGLWYVNGYKVWYKEYKGWNSPHGRLAQMYRYCGMPAHKSHRLTVR